MKIILASFLLATAIQVKKCDIPIPVPSPQPSTSPSPVPSSSPSSLPSPSPVPSPSPTLSPSPIPSPSPSPSTGTPSLTSNGNYPVPATGTCPVWFKDSLSRVGVAFLSERPCSGNCQAQGYLGFIYNFHATPKSFKPYCEHSCYNEAGEYSPSFCRAQCEQFPACQPKDPAMYVYPPNDTPGPCDKLSSNLYICHHKPLKHQAGDTRVEACPPDAPMNSTGCSSVFKQIPTPRLTSRKRTVKK